MDVTLAYDKFHELRNQGRNLPDIAQEIDVSIATIRRWESERIRENKIKRNAFLEDNTSNFVSVDEMSPLKDVGMILWRLGFATVAAVMLYKIAGSFSLFLSKIL